MNRKIILLFFIFVTLSFCSNDNSTNSRKASNKTGNLFFSDWHQKKIEIPANTVETALPAQTSDVKISVDYSDKINKISPYFSGINATTYTGKYQNNAEIIHKISQVQNGFIRFPGGDASNVYFFDGLPADIPDKVLTHDGSWDNFHNGLEDVSWKMNTHDFYNFLTAVNSEGFITVNYAYARYGLSDDPVSKAASHAADWVRFDNGRTKFWEIGNETYACWEGGFRIDSNTNQDGQPEYINGALYGQHFRVFADSMRAAAEKNGIDIYIGAVFADNDFIWDGSGRNITKTWNAQLAKELKREDGTNYADFITVHSYFLDDSDDQPDEVIDTYHDVEEMQNFVYGKLAAAGVADVPLVLSEWNVKSGKQTTQVGAMQAVAAQCQMQELGYGGSCYFAIKDYWRGNEGDFAMFAHEDPNFPESGAYANFYHFYYLQTVLGDEMINTQVISDNNDIVAFATSYGKGGIGMVIINKSIRTHILELDLQNFIPDGRLYWYEISRYNTNDLWSEKVIINGIANDLQKGGPDIAIVPARTAIAIQGAKLSVNGLSAIYIKIEGE
ncbi:MAG: hypothetical protein JXQ65_11140 [Candidatus Marinimicrobia bacterium]|nr:hypothetical protein [Candidatus Neomarinimicrobiota bacterium]